MARKERERRYIAEYMKAKFPEGNWQLNVPLGPVPDYLVETFGTLKAGKIFRPTRPRVDAVKWSSDRYILIEAKVREVKTGVGDLAFYRALIPDTPDLPFYDGQRIIYRLVVPWSIDWIQAAAGRLDIEVDVVWQDWIADYVREKQHYHTSEYRAQRAEKLALREKLGLE